MEWATREMINEVEGLSALTLHDSHANLFDVLIARLFTLEGTGAKNDCRILWQYWNLHVMELKQPPPHYIQSSFGLDGDVSTVLRHTKAGWQTELWVIPKKFGFSFSLLLKSWHFCATGFKVHDLHRTTLWITNKKMGVLRHLAYVNW